MLLFSTLLYTRLQSGPQTTTSQNVDSDSGPPESLRHDEAQSVMDSARTIRYRTTLHQPLEEGFRSSYQTTDHLATYRMIEQKCHEWAIKMWIATIDVTKALDSITHKSICKALKSCGINHEYISLLKKIYKDQKASVLTDEESGVFEIKKGAKQGDPLSSLLLNTVLQAALKDDLERWREKGMGISLASRTCDSPTTSYYFPRPWSSSEVWCATSKKVQKVWDWESAQTRRKFSATKGRTRKKRRQLTTSK